MLPSLLTRLGVAGFQPFLAKALGRDVLDPALRPAPVLSQDTGRSRGAAFKYALTDSTHKYFRVHAADGSVDEWLFDLEADPHELRDVASAHPERLASMRDRTLALVAERSSRGKRLRGGAAEAVGEEIPPQLRRDLCALGYLAPEACAEPPAAPEPAAPAGGS